MWDPRSSQSLQTITSTLPAMTALDVHPQSELLSVGSANQIIKVFTLNGDNISTIRYHDGFMGQRIGPISCLAFHPYWVSLTVTNNARFHFHAYLCGVFFSYFSMDKHTLTVAMQCFSWIVNDQMISDETF